MTEPETITLRRLPAEHVLREGIDLFKSNDSMCFRKVSSSSGNTVYRWGTPCYCRAEDYPPEYDKPAIDAGEGWRMLEPDEGAVEGDEYFGGRDWLKSYKHLCDRVQNPVFKYRRRITQQPDRLTELRQQGERQAARIVELEKKLKEADGFTQVAMDTKRDMQRQITQRDEQIAGLRARVKELETTSKSLRWERRKPTDEEQKTRFWLLKTFGGSVMLYEPSRDVWGEDWDRRDMICILPPIAGPEPEPKMVTQRRWLCHNGSHSWVEVWPNDGDEPTDQWVERFRTDVTREVPE